MIERVDMRYDGSGDRRFRGNMPHCGAYGRRRGDGKILFVIGKDMTAVLSCSLVTLVVKLVGDSTVV